jgi:transposase-like protein
MKKKPRSYSVDFKQEAVRQMAEATTIRSREAARFVANESTG